MKGQALLQVHFNNAKRKSPLVLLSLLTVFFLTIIGCSAEQVDYSRPPYDQAELDQLHRDWSDSLWEMVTGSFPDAQRPTVELVRYVESDEWIGEVLAQCLMDMGIEATYNEETTGTEFGGPPEQLEDTLIGVYTCQTQYLERPERPLSPELQYVYDTTVLTKCLEDQGYEVPEPPSKQAYIEGSVWNPYENVGAASKQEALVSRACPGAPPETGLP